MKMGDVIEAIIDNYDQDEIFDLITELDDEVCDFEFTRKLTYYFNEVMEKEADAQLAEKMSEESA
jgi:hypothetical protein